MRRPPTPPSPDDALAVECPTCEQTIPVTPGISIEATVAAHDQGCRPKPAHRKSRIECPDCGRHLATIQRRGGWEAQVERLHALHVCKHPTTHTTRRSRNPAMTSTPTTPAPQAQCPPAKDLTSHPDTRIARQARKVLAENDKLTALWRADQGNAALRAEIAAMEATLKAKRQQLRTGQKAGHPAPATGPALPAKQIREWAAGQGMPCPAAGKLPAAVVDAWKASQQEVAS